MLTYTQKKIILRLFTLKKIARKFQIFIGGREVLSENPYNFFFKFN